MLTAARLLTADRGTVEVAHEALFREWPRLEGWLDEDAQGRRVRAHLTEAAHEWDDSGRTPGELYRGARLAAVLDWTGEHAAEVNELERQFVAESQAAGQAEERRQRRANRRLRLLLVGACVGLVLAVAAGDVALVQRAQAQQSQAVADAERTVADQERAAADAQTVIAEHAADTADAQRLGAQGLAPRTSTSRCCSPARGSRSTTRRRRGPTCSPRSCAARRRSGSRGRSAAGRRQIVGEPRRHDAARQEQRGPDRR